MALKIKTIPELCGKIARRFVIKANKNYSNKKSIDFKNEVQSAKKILDKSKLNKHVK